MLFNTYTFLIFFLVMLMLYYVPLPWRVKKFNLLIGSYLFYAAWNPPFVAILWVSTVADWFLAQFIHRTSNHKLKRLFLLGSLAVNLGMLSFFKYGGFVVENFAVLLEALGVLYSPPKWNIILPVGISFFTFQTLSYTIDIYRGKLRPSKSFLDYALYVTFFPQLVAGPIVRAVDFLPQCLVERKVSMRHFGWGISLMIIGLFMKVVVADGYMAPVADKIFGSSGILVASAVFRLGLLSENASS